MAESLAHEGGGGLVNGWKTAIKLEVLVECFLMLLMLMLLIGVYDICSQ